MKRKRQILKQTTATILAVSQFAVPTFAATGGAWETTGNEWKYKDQNGEYLKNTWFRDPSDNRLYFLNETGVMESGWKCINGVWYFLTNVHSGFYGAALENTWAWIDGYCYYFGQDGKMVSGGTTSDGFTVNADGQWTENGKAVYIAGRGYITKQELGSTTTTHTSGSSGGGSRKSSRSSGSSSKNDTKTKNQTETNNDNGEIYSYTIRYVSKDGDVLAIETGSAQANSIITAEEKQIDGYLHWASAPLTFHLTMDHAVFSVQYEKASTGVMYTVNFAIEDGITLGGYADYGIINGTVTPNKAKLQEHLPEYELVNEGGYQWKLTKDKHANVFTATVRKRTNTDQKQETEKEPQPSNAEEKGALSYTIRYIGSRNEIIEQVSGRGNAGDTVTAEGKEFDGYQRVGSQPLTATLETDGQFVDLYYTAVDLTDKNPNKQEKNTICSYAVYYMDSHGNVLKRLEGSGTYGTSIEIPQETFDGYTEQSGQEHTVTLPENGVATFTILYEGSSSENQETLSYTIRYASMDNTVLEEFTGNGRRGETIAIPSEEFDGVREIENQLHEVILLNDQSIFSIKYEAIRTPEPELEPVEYEAFQEDEESNDVVEEELETETLAQHAQNMISKKTVIIESDTEEEAEFSYEILFVDENGKTVGTKTGHAPEGSIVKIPELVLDGYEMIDIMDDFELTEDGQTVEIQCEDISGREDSDGEEVMLLSEEDEETGEEKTATVSEASSYAADTQDSDSTVTDSNARYYYAFIYSDRDTGEIISAETGYSYEGAVLEPLNVPVGYIVADHEPFVIKPDNKANAFTVWCINKKDVKPEGYVDYTIDCVDAAGNIIKTFTGSAPSGVTIRPHYEIDGYDMDTSKEYAFKLSETNFHFEVLYIKYKVFDYEFRITDIDSGEVLDTKTITGRGGREKDVELTADDLTPEGYELISSIPERVRISSNPANNFYNIYVRRKQETPNIEDLRPYIIHFVSYQDSTKRILDDKVGIAVVGSTITASYLMKINLPDGTYEAIASTDTMTFKIDGTQDVNEYYVRFYKTADYEDTKTEMKYSIRLQAEDTGSILNVMTGCAYPGKRIYYRNTFRDYSLGDDDQKFFVVTDNPDDNYITVPLHRVTLPAPTVNEHTGKYDGAEWIMTFSDEKGNLLLPWRTGFTRKGDNMYIDYPDTIEGSDGTIYRALKTGPYVEYMNGTVYRQFNIKYTSGAQSENLLEKWEKAAQESLDEIRRTVPYTYTVIYREKDSWNDVGIYTGVGTKDETITIQGIPIPGYTYPKDQVDPTFVLDEDEKQVIFYVEAIDNKQSMKKEQDDYRIRFTDGNGTSVLPPVVGYMAYETNNSYNYMTLHYPNTFRDKNGDIWTADEQSPKQLTMWSLSANDFEITYHKTFENKFENMFADTPEDAQRILTEMAVFTVDAKEHSYYVIGRNYNPMQTEVSSVVSRYNLSNYGTELVDQFEMDGITYYVARVSYVHTWNPESCTHDMHVTRAVEAGCEVTGSVTETCAKCGYSETTYYQALGHVDADHDGMCDRDHVMMALNVGDEITVTWDPGSTGKNEMKLNFICLDTDYQGTGKKLLMSEDAIDPAHYGSYSISGNVDYGSSDLRGYLESEFLNRLSNRLVLTSVGEWSVGLLSKEEYDKYKKQAENNYAFPDSLTVLYEKLGEDGKVQLSDGSRVTPEEAGTKPVRPILFMDAGGATEGIVSGQWHVGDIQSRQIGDESYLFRCVNDNYKDNSNLDKTMAIFVCDTVLPSYTGLEYDAADSKRDTRFFGENNNYRYSNIHKFLTENQKETGSLVTMDIGVMNEYSGTTKAGAFETLDERDLTKHKRDRAQYLESKLFIPSVEEALDMKTYLWKFNRSEKDNIASVYDGNYATGYWLRTPVYGTDDMVYTVNLENGTIEPHSVKEEFAIPGTSASMEYSEDNGQTWKDCTDRQTIVGSERNFLVRYKQYGETATPVMGTGGMYVLTQTTSSMEYSTDGGNTWKNCSDGETAVGVSSACLIRSKSGSRTMSALTIQHMLLSTTPEMEWSGDNGATWKTCSEGQTIVPSVGTYLTRQKSNPDGWTETKSSSKYCLTGTQTGWEYSNDNENWTLCADGTTYVDDPGEYTVRRTNAGIDRKSVKQTCSIGIRPMYVVYQEH